MEINPLALRVFLSPRLGDCGDLRGKRDAVDPRRLVVKLYPIPRRHLALVALLLGHLVLIKAELAPKLLPAVHLRRLLEVTGLIAGLGDPGGFFPDPPRLRVGDEDLDPLAGHQRRGDPLIDEVLSFLTIIALKVKLK